MSKEVVANVLDVIKASNAEIDSSTTPNIGNPKEISNDNENDDVMESPDDEVIEDEDNDDDIDEGELEEIDLASVVEEEVNKSLKDTKNVQNEVIPWPTPVADDFISVQDGLSWPNLDSQSNDEVLEWINEQQKLLVRTVTWNLQAKRPPSIEEVSAKLIPNNKFHLYIIGTEECERSIAKSAVNTSKKNWESYLKRLLGLKYIPIRSHTLQAIHIMAFAHVAVAPLISEISSAAVATGLANTLGNKGAVAILLKIGSSRMIILNAHLAAHQNKIKQRNDMMNKIEKELPALLLRKIITGSPPTATASPTATATVTPAGMIPATPKRAAGNQVAPEAADPEPVVAVATAVVAKDPLPPPVVQPLLSQDPPQQQQPQREGRDRSGSNKNLPIGAPAATTPATAATTVNVLYPSSDVSGLIGLADAVIVMGDLNYRIRGNRSIVDKLLQNNMREVLLSNDQLKWSIDRGQVLSGYSEKEIVFRPTYKFDKNTNVYDSSPKRRIPGWTDRILYTPAKLDCLNYGSDESLRSSDHRPVYASFVFHVRIADTDRVKVKTDHEFSSASQVCTVM